MRIRPGMFIVVRSRYNPFRYGSDRRRLFDRLLAMSDQITVRNFAATVGQDVNSFLRYASNRGHIELSWHGVPVRATVAVPNYAPVPAAAPVEYLPKFGVEMELVMAQGMTHSALARALTDAGIECYYEGYNHFTRPTWKIVTDVSIRTPVGLGAEIVSPPLLGEAGFEQVQKVCAVLKDVGCTVNKTCGHHVHVNAAGLGLDFFRRLAALYGTNEDLLDSVMPASRRGPLGGNGYCMSVKNFRQVGNQTSVEDAAMMIIPQRHSKLNLSAYRRHKTVEFRHHSGTIEADKICSWVRLCIAMCDFARGTTEVPASSNLEAFLQDMNVSVEDKTYFQNRRAYFARRENRTNEEREAA